MCKRFNDAIAPLEQQWSVMMSDYFKRQRSAVLARVNGTAKAWAGKNLSAASDPFDLAEWNRRLAATVTPVLTDTVMAGGTQALDQLGLSVSFDLRDPEAEAWLAAKQQKFSRQINETSWQDLRASLTQGLANGESVPDLMNRVRQTFAAYEDFRVERIARTEVVGASNAGTYLAATQTGQVETKTWLAALDHRTRASHVAAHGQTVAMDANFKVGSAEGPVPHQMGQAREVVNCRCTVIYNLKAERPVAQLPMTPNTPPAAPPPAPPPAPKPPRAPRKPKEPAAPAVPAAPPPFPADLKTLEEVQYLGGTKDARLMRDPATNATYILTRGTSPEHIRAEMAADGVYTAFAQAGLDVRVPEFKRYLEFTGPMDMTGTPVKLTRTSEGKLLSEAKPTQRKKANEILRETFVLDALLGNTEVVGVDKGNVQIGADGVLRRMDNSGALGYMLDGRPKAARDWSAGVEELWSMRDRRENPNMAEITKGLTTADITKQIRTVLAAYDANRAAIVDAMGVAPNAPELIATFNARVESLRRLERVSTRMIDDGFVEEYVNEFGRAYQGLTAVGVPDRLPKSLQPRQNGDVREVFDPYGDKFDSLRYDTLGGNNPQARQGVQSAQGLLKDYMQEQGTSYRTLEAYGQDQGGDSWSRISVAAKAHLFAIRPVPFDDLYWHYYSNVTDEASLKQQADKALRGGGLNKKKFEAALTINHAYTYMMLENVEMPRHDRDTQTLTAWRTEGMAVMNAQNWSVGDTIVPRRGYLESFSGFYPIGVRGMEATIQTVPFHRVFGTYFESRGSPYQGLFLGDNENEWVIMPHGIPSKYVGNLRDLQMTGEYKAVADTWEADAKAQP